MPARVTCGHFPIQWLGAALRIAVFLAAWAVPAAATDHFNLESGIPTSIEDITPSERGTFELHAFGSSSWTAGERATG